MSPTYLGMESCLVAAHAAIAAIRDSRRRRRFGDQHEGHRNGQHQRERVEACGVASGDGRGIPRLRCCYYSSLFVLCRVSLVIRETRL